MGSETRLTGASIVLLGLFVQSGVCAAPLQDQSSSPAASDAAQTASSAPVHLSRDVVKGYLLHKVAPKYPEKARREYIQGTVKMRAVIDTTGNIADLRVISGDPILTEAALKAVKQWRYRPYVVDGKTVAVDTEITVNFALDGH